MTRLTIANPEPGLVLFKVDGMLSSPIIRINLAQYYARHRQQPAIEAQTGCDILR